MNHDRVGPHVTAQTANKPRPTQGPPAHFSVRDDGVHAGADNMARDEAMLAAAVPAVRLYGWTPACISLGRTQTTNDIDAQAARAEGLDVVARKTGGGAILHNAEEVTYAVVLPLDFPGLPSSIMGSYKFISQPVLDTFRALGANATFGEGRGGRDTLCYLREEGVSIFVDGKKISGGAQRRTQAAVLQHGTLVVRRDAQRTARVLRAPVDTVRAKVVGLDTLGIHAPRTDIVRVLADRFAKRLGTPGPDADTQPTPADPSPSPIG